ncbi:hypothetical protein HLB23_25385 [Nocardia uniformis]|uniref:Uncharacterized protein n=1 Tax=Nocardia uniformis TaxID=53432 RepID=A0A849C342_9NOCA|nr:hypothetical protein [Nocardia uniformis]NNH73153.1 hypothetical protein [Nocardia uniformis]
MTVQARSDSCSDFAVDRGFARLDGASKPLGDAVLPVAHHPASHSTFQQPGPFAPARRIQERPVLLVRESGFLDHCGRCERKAVLELPGIDGAALQRFPTASVVEDHRNGGSAERIGLAVEICLHGLREFRVLGDFYGQVDSRAVLLQFGAPQFSRAGRGESASAPQPTGLPGSRELEDGFVGQGVRCFLHTGDSRCGV